VVPPHFRFQYYIATTGGRRSQTRESGMNAPAWTLKKKIHR